MDTQRRHTPLTQSLARPLAPRCVAVLLVCDLMAAAQLLKVNQIGSVTESIEAVSMAQEAGWGVMTSHRSGETEDTFIADLGVGQTPSFHAIFSCVCLSLMCVKTEDDCPDRLARNTERRFGEN